MTRSVLLSLAGALLVGVAIGTGGAEGPRAPIVLPVATAVGVRVDTLLIGGYAEGSFAEAVRQLATDLHPSERALVGQHLDRIFRDVLTGGGLGPTGRLRVAYERAVRPNGATRSIRVLGAEVAVSGRVHTAFYYEREGHPGYFDPFGQPLDVGAWGGPLRAARVSSSFGDRRMHPILNRLLPHHGVDLAAPVGEEVRATGDGLIVAAGWNGGYGLVVEIQHPNGYSTRYAHLSRLEDGLRSGRTVERGERIGYVGMTGLATGPHLHYEVRRRGQPLDPMSLSEGESLSFELGPDPDWPRERERVAALLARAPTLVRAPTPSTGTR